MDLREIGEKVVASMHFPGDTQEWIDCLKSENYFKLRKLLKKERKNLPQKYRKLYMAPEVKIQICLHFLRSSYPFFTKQEKDRSNKFIALQQKIADGIDVLNKKMH